MKTRILISGLVLSAGLRAHAQQTTALSPMRADTVHAVHQLFSKHCVGGSVWTVIGAAFTGRIIGSTVGSNANAAGAAVSIAVLGGIPAGIGLGKLVRFSAGRESAVLSAYNAGEPLPHYVRRRLKKTKYFTMQ